MRRIRFLLPLACLVLFLWGAVSLSQQTAPSPLASPPERWFKGNLHTHSLWSDGNDFPEMIVSWYHGRGYHFLALSDHNILSEGQKWIDPELGARRGAIAGFDRYLEAFGDDWVEQRVVDGKPQVRLKPLNEFRPLFEERGKFLLIQSEEITDSFQRYPVHINVANLRDVIKPQGGGSVRETIANNLEAVERQSQRTGRPMLPHLNHPNFGYGVTAEDLAAVVAERFFEVYNGHPSVNHRGDKDHPSVERLWDIANTIRLGRMQAPPLYGLATDDSHNYFGQRGSSPGRGWVMVRARRLTPESLIAAMKRGDFYASSGVTLQSVSYDAEKRELRVKIDPQPGEEYTTQFIGTLEDFDGEAAAEEPAASDGDGSVESVDPKSPAIGRVLAEVEGTEASYTLTGKELYVRAMVQANRPPENPAFKGQVKQAWTQPVGWQRRVAHEEATAAE